MENVRNLDYIHTFLFCVLFNVFFTFKMWVIIPVEMNTFKNYFQLWRLLVDILVSSHSSLNMNLLALFLAALLGSSPAEYSSCLVYIQTDGFCSVLYFLRVIILFILYRLTQYLRFIRVLIINIIMVTIYWMLKMCQVLC